MFFGSRYSDLCYGYNAFWHDVVGQLTLDANGFEIETMMNIRALRAGLFVVEVPSFEEARIHGESKLSTLKDGWRVLRTIFAELRPFVPLHPTPRASLEPESEASERASA
jgi:hypothetical protein